MSDLKPCPPLYSDGVHDDGPWLKWMLEHRQDVRDKVLWFAKPIRLRKRLPPGGSVIEGCTFRWLPTSKYASAHSRLHYVEDVTL